MSYANARNREFLLEVGASLPIDAFKYEDLLTFNTTGDVEFPTQLPSDFKTELTSYLKFIAGEMVNLQKESELRMESWKKIDPDLHVLLDKPRLFFDDDVITWLKREILS